MSSAKPAPVMSSSAQGDDAFFTAPLSDTDPEIWRAVRDELKRQRDKIELIASENIVSAAVLEAQVSVLTNKYATSYPGRRTYVGIAHVQLTKQIPHTLA